MVTFPNMDQYSCLRGNPGSSQAKSFNDRHGCPVKIDAIPFRIKGSGFFPGDRSEESRVLIVSQIREVARNLAHSIADFDEKNADWVIFQGFRLPPQWRVSVVHLLIVFPREYPIIPPSGFYLPAYLKCPQGYASGFQEALSSPVIAGWIWYRCAVKSDFWRHEPASPQAEFKHGANLRTYITLIRQLLEGDSAS